VQQQWEISLQFAVISISAFSAMHKPARIEDPKDRKGYTATHLCASRVETLL
jgi:hypothetical protein